MLRRLRIKLRGLSPEEENALRARLGNKPYYALFELIYSEAHSAGAETLFDPPIYRLIQEALSQFLQQSSVARSGKSAIDFGCGEGANAIYLAQHGYQVTAIDLSPSAIARAQERAAAAVVDIDFRVGDVVHLDELADQMFDIGINVGTLHMLVADAHRQQHIAEMWRVLKPGGVLFAFNNLARRDVRIENIEKYLYTCMATTEARDVSVNGTRREIVFHGVGFRSASLPQYRKEFERAGFEIMEVRSCQAPSRFWDYLKPGRRASQRFLTMQCRKP